MASAVRLDNITGTSIAVSADAPGQPWATCWQPTDPVPATRYTALVARVGMLDKDGTLIGYAYAMLSVDVSLLQQLGAASGASITLAQSSGPVLSTERADRAQRVRGTALALNGTATSGARRTAGTYGYSPR